jgi:hypothetical protein
MIRWLVFALLAAILPAQAAQWQHTLATTASLRTGGARLISSDALALDDGESALITYWEILHATADLDIYRCVDVVGRQFSPLRQTCWKVLTPAGRPPVQDE